MALGQSRAMDSHSATLDAGEKKCFGVREIKISVFWSQRGKKGAGVEKVRVLARGFFS